MDKNKEKTKISHKKGIVYAIVNKINNKMYIGITMNKYGFNGRYDTKGVGIERVYKYHKRNKDYGRNYNSHLLNSIEKYGFVNFRIDYELDNSNSREDLIKKEKFYITKYKTYDVKYGYNKTMGGDGIKKISAEQKYELRRKQRIRAGERFNKKVDEMLDEIKKNEGNINLNYFKEFYNIREDKKKYKLSKYYNIALMLYKNNPKHKIKKCECCGKYILLNKNNKKFRKKYCDKCREEKNRKYSRECVKRCVEKVYKQQTA